MQEENNCRKITWRRGKRGVWSDRISPGKRAWSLLPLLVPLHIDLCLARAPHWGFKLSLMLSLQPPIERKEQRNHSEYLSHQKTVIQISSSIFILCWLSCQAPNLGNRSWNEQCLHSFAMLCQYWITESYRLHAGSDIQLSSFGIFITTFYMTLRKALPTMNCKLLNSTFSRDSWKAPTSGGVLPIATSMCDKLRPFSRTMVYKLHYTMS